MLPAARRAAKCISKLKSEASRYRIPSIYVNDNFGRWQSDFRAQVRHCLSESARGCSIVQTLQPEESDYFVLKPKHSGFYSTNLEVLLQHLQIDSLILTGFAGNICVMFTANDAYMRNYKLFVPGDCVASNTDAENSFALEQMQRVLKANVEASDRLNLASLSNPS